LDRASISGLNHWTEGSGGQDGDKILDVEMPYEQAQQNTGLEMYVLSLTLDYNRSGGLSVSHQMSAEP
jgi:hypothetical protein